MNQLDLFYRAFNDFKKHTKSNMECVRFQRSSQALKKSEEESIVAKFATCTIEEDWIKAIENGIPFILKAIKEERQFIRNDGEVLPIEKVRKTSKYSIQDLAKHSNYISHEAPEHLNTDIMPDKVLVIRKENDYTVYENRVVYALLLYLQDFVSLRLNKIKELTNKYEANAKINKKMIIGNRSLDFEMNLNEIIKDDPIAMQRNSYQALIERIDTIYANIVSLLKTPLMQEVSKVDVVTRPITKTNVLRMNRNFKESLALFDYIAEYEGPGYTVNVTQKSFNPLAMPITFDYTEMMMLSSFITYMHANGLTEMLKANFDAEEERIKQEEENRLIEKAKRLEIKAKMAEKTIHEYLLILDEANKLLEAKNDELKAEIATIEGKHKQHIDLIKQEQKQELDQLNFAHQDEVNKINLEHSEAIEEINKGHQEEIDNLKAQYQQEVDALNATINEKQDEIEHVKKQCAFEIEVKTNELEKLKQDTVEDAKNVIAQAQVDKEKAEAELLAIRLASGYKADPNDFTSKERFNELEREKQYLDEFFNKAWKATKKQIYKDVMKEKPAKKFKSKKKDLLPETDENNQEPLLGEGSLIDNDEEIK